MTSETGARAVVARVLNETLRDSGRSAQEFADSDLLVEGLGFDSLDLAVAVVKLEQATGRDPFRAGAQPVRTFGALVALYEQAGG